MVLFVLSSVVADNGFDSIKLEVLCIFSLLLRQVGGLQGSWLLIEIKTYFD